MYDYGSAFIGSASEYLYTLLSWLLVSEGINWLVEEATYLISWTTFSELFGITRVMPL